MDFHIKCFEEKKSRPNTFCRSRHTSSRKESEIVASTVKNRGGEKLFPAPKEFSATGLSDGLLKRKVENFRDLTARPLDSARLGFEHKHNCVSRPRWLVKALSIMLPREVFLCCRKLSHQSTWYYEPKPTRRITARSTAVWWGEDRRNSWCVRSEGASKTKHEKTASFVEKCVKSGEERKRASSREYPWR